MLRLCKNGGPHGGMALHTAGTTLLGVGVPCAPCGAYHHNHWRAHLVHYHLQVAQQMGVVLVVGLLARGEYGGASPPFGVVLHQRRLLGLPKVVLGPCALLNPLLGHRHLP